MDLYDILGIRRSASLAEVRRAYQKLARALHPDLNPGDPAAAERFGTISRAFEVLSDPQRRAEYDRGGSVSAPPPAEPEVGFDGFDFEAELRIGRSGFREIFDGVLNAAPPEQARARGEDLEQSTRVSFEEAFAGAKRQMQVTRLEACPICEGRGDVEVGATRCPSCQGTGRVRARRGHMIFSHRCGECGASGVIDRRPCARCAGEGRLMRSERLGVEIPAGVSDGMRLHVPGAGNAGRRGGEPGDFFLTVYVEPHAFYTRKADDLLCLVPMSAVEAALGGHVEVPTPDGPVTIELPAGTQPGQRFRLRKRGMPRLGGRGRGDLYVEAQVVVPTVTDDRGRALLLELAALHPEDPRRSLAERLAARPAEAKG